MSNARILMSCGCHPQWLHLGKTIWFQYWVLNWTNVQLPSTKKFLESFQILSPETKKASEKWVLIYQHQTKWKTAQFWIKLNKFYNWERWRAKCNLLVHHWTVKNFSSQLQKLARIQIIGRRCKKNCTSNGHGPFSLWSRYQKCRFYW